MAREVVEVPGGLVEQWVCSVFVARIGTRTGFDSLPSWCGGPRGGAAAYLPLFKPDVQNKE